MHFHLNTSHTSLLLYSSNQGAQPKKNENNYNQKLKMKIISNFHKWKIIFLFHYFFIITFYYLLFFILLLSFYKTRLKITFLQKKISFFYNKLVLDFFLYLFV